MRRLIPFALGFALAAPAAADPAASALLERARMWEARNRDDLVRNAIDKLFRIAPDHPDGLALLAPLQLRAEQGDAARKTLERLRTVQPDHPGVARTEALLRLKGGDQSKLRQARLLARSGKTEAALAAWRTLYPNGVPDGDLAVEYWQLLASTGNGWEAARAGLARLVQDNPDNRRYRLALAAHLLARQPANPEARKVVIELARHPAHAREAKLVWRRTMLKLDPTANSIALIQEYLAQDAGDSAVRERLAGVIRAVDAQRKLLADPAYRARLDGLALLKGDQLDAAEEQLLRALADRPADAAATGAMGLVRLRQGHHAEAEAYFLQARQLAPGDAAKWSGLARTARYWRLMRQAGDARDGGELALAEQKLLAARELDAREPNAAIALARLYADWQRGAEAERSYRAALALEPANATAIGGLATLYLRNGRERDAEKLIAGLTPSQRRELGGTLNGVRAGMLRDQADHMQVQGRTEHAIALLERAAEIDLGDPWLRYDLARLHARQGAAGKGQAVFDELLARRPNDAVALYAMALFQSGIDQEMPALASLERVAGTERSANMERLQRRLWIGVQSRRAVALDKIGQGDLARKVLAQIEAACGNDRDLALEIAAAQIELGEAAQARALLDRFAAASPAPPPAWRLSHARLLARSGADERLSRLLDDIENAGPLAAESMESLKDLRLSLALRNAETLRRRGRLEQARQALRPGLAAYPGERRLLQAEAGILRAMGQGDAARDGYERILLLHPEDREAVLALIDTLIEGGHRPQARERIEQQLARTATADPDFMSALAGALLDLDANERAGQLVDDVLAIAPDHQRALAQAGQLARREGRIEQAVNYLQRALASEMAQRFPLAVPALSRLYRAQDGGALLAAPAAPETIAAEQGAGGPYRDLSELLDQRTTWLSAALDWRTRPGTEGKSSLNVKEIPFEWKQPWRGDGQLMLRADLVRIGAGSLDLADTTETATFGSMLLCQPLCGSGMAPQRAAGVALNAGIERPGLKMDLGTTPLGFPVQNLVGGILRKGELGPFSYSVDLSRRPLAGSLLSYAGARDPRSGQLWGGVLASGVRFGLSKDDGGRFGEWASLGLHRLDGKNVQANMRMQLMAGGYWRAINEDDRLLTLGLTAMHWRFSENAGEYTFGHGGYYSPGTYSSIALPVSFGQRYARFSYTVRASVSLSRSQARTAGYYPTDAGMQRQAEALAAVNGIDPHYSGGPGHGRGRSLSAAWEYQLDPRLFVGGRLEFDRSADYAPNSLLMYLRYAVDHAAARPVFLPPQAPVPTSRY